MALFTLKLNDNVNTPIDFIGSTYKVSDGGFDISTPRRKRELAVLRPGFYIPMSVNEEYREAELTFQVVGATRSAVISSINAIERMLGRINSRSRLFNGQRCELQYTWSGATTITYFEVFGGDLSYPPDVLSIDKIHYTDSSGNYKLPEIKLKLYLSANGYGISIFSTSMTELPLYNPGIGTPATGGVQITNPGYNNYNYVEIDAGDLDGSTPMITKIILTPGSTYTSWYDMYIGHQVTPFPTVTLFEAEDYIDLNRGTTYAHANASGSPAEYVRWTHAASAGYDSFAAIAWEVSNGSAGVYYAFTHAFGYPVPQSIQSAIGLDDYVTYRINYRGDYVSTINNSQTVVPVGVIQLPPGPKELSDQGTLNSDLWMGLFYSWEGSETIDIDFLSLLPMNAGLRILKFRGTSTAFDWTLIDDDWLGLQFSKDVGGTNEIATPWFGLLDPIKLEPGIDQRLYFDVTSDDYQPGERNRQFDVQVYVVPTFSSLAL